jgi:hypothetical protein
MQSAAEKIVDGMDSEDWQAAWLNLARERGHVLKVEGGSFPLTRRIDLFVTSTNGHNGPGCINCGWTECMHCDWKGERIPVCTDTSKSEET